MNRRKATGDLREPVAAQCVRLEQLRCWEQEIEALKRVEADLEVEKISADVALKRATEKNRFGIKARDAAKIAEALARRKSAERAMRMVDDSPNGGEPGGATETEQLRAAIDALNNWLGAASTAAGWRRPRIAYAFIGVACLATIGAALAVHIMLLVLLAPLAMALGYLAYTERDADWIRLGAVRRFDQTMLRPPSSWQESAVQSRLKELNNQLADAEHRMSGGTVADGEYGRNPEAEDASEIGLAMELVEASDQFDAELRKAGIAPGSVGEELVGWLQHVHDVRRIGDALTEARTRRKSLNSAAEECRDAIFRFLALNDSAPPAGQADVVSLESGLQQLLDSNDDS